MAVGKLIKPLLLLLASTLAQAEELNINPNHPDHYTVVKGDTLWGISAKFLKTPWQWPQLWHNNPQVKNPHRIYPGDTLHFVYVNGQPQLSLSPGPSRMTMADLDSEQNGEITLVPHIRESGIEQVIPLIPSDAIAPFLTHPEVVGESTMQDAPYVIDFAGDHLVAGAGDKVYARSIPDPESLGYTIYRPGKPYIDPDTDEILGYEALYIAEATIEKAGDPATLIIDKFSAAINTGDRLMPNAEGVLALNYFPKPPAEPMEGHIIRVLGGVSHIGQYDVVVIDRGRADGLEPGHILNVYQRGRLVLDRYKKGYKETVQMPNEIIGEVMIFRPFERVSYALALTMEGAARVMDHVASP